MSGRGGTVSRTFSIPGVGIGNKDYSPGRESYVSEPSLLFTDDFEVLRSYQTTGSAGFAVARVTTRSWRGSACLRLRTGTLGGGAFDNAVVNFNFGIVGSQKVLADLAVSFPATFADEVVILALERFTGALRRNFGVRYNVDTTMWQYVDAAAVWQDIEAQSLNLDPDIWHRIQFGVDFENWEYLFVRCNEQLMDLSGIAGEGAASVTDAYVVLRVLGGGAVAAQDFHMDNVRVSELI